MFLKKRGQVTIFIILAIIIVGAAVLVYFLYPTIRANISNANNPNSFIQTCMQDQIKSVINNISLQGGKVDPNFYYEYKGNKIQYLCYTNQYYIPCLVQEPALQTSIQDEMDKNLQATANLCFDELKKSFESRGYTVNLIKGNVTAELLPKVVSITLNDKLVLTKSGTQSYSFFRILVNNNLYELTGIANSIISWEATYGDAETTDYMSYYHDLKVEKKKQSDGTTVYILTDLNNGGKFQFASRSLAWPPGYAQGQTV